MVTGTQSDHTHVGKLGDSPLAELLAHAYGSSFTGQLLLECGDGRRHSLGISGGAVCAAAVSDEGPEPARVALGEALPSDTMRFVEAHAERLGAGLIAAARALALLSDGAFDLTMRKLLELRVLGAVALPPSTMFAFFEGVGRSDSSDGPSEPLEPFGLILRCLLAEPASDRFRRHVQPIEHVKLYLDAESPALHGAFAPPFRHLVHRLRGVPQTIAELLRQGVVPDLQVFALVHMLRLTQQIRISAEPAHASGPPGPIKRVPRTISGGALRAAAAAPSSMPARSFEEALPEHLRAALRPARVPSSLPPRASLEPPNQTEAELRRRWPERAAEARALQEWADAQGDPSQLERAASVVERLARLFPRNPRIRYYCGCLFAMAGRLEPAIHELRHALELDPNNPEAIFELDRLKRRRR